MTQLLSLNRFILLKHFFKVMKIYEQGSGAKLNVFKTEAMWLGVLRSRTYQPLGLSWVSKMKILGVVFGQVSTSETWRPKSFYFIKYFFRAKLSSFQSEWSFLGDNSSPSALLLMTYYSDCLSTLDCLRRNPSCQDWNDFVFTSKKCSPVILWKKNQSTCH